MRKIANQTHTPEVLAQLEWPATFVDFTARSPSSSAADGDNEADADAVTPAPVMPGSTATGSASSATNGTSSATGAVSAEAKAAEDSATDAAVATHLRAHRFILALSSVSDPGNLGTVDFLHFYSSVDFITISFLCCTVSSCIAGVLATIYDLSRCLLFIRHPSCPVSTMLFAIYLQALCFAPPPR